MSILLAISSEFDSKILVKVLSFYLMPFLSYVKLIIYILPLRFANINYILVFLKSHLSHTVNCDTGRRVIRPTTPLQVY